MKQEYVAIVLMMMENEAWVLIVEGNDKPTDTEFSPASRLLP